MGIFRLSYILLLNHDEISCPNTGFGRNRSDENGKKDGLDRYNHR